MVDLERTHLQPASVTFFLPSRASSQFCHIHRHKPSVSCLLFPMMQMQSGASALFSRWSLASAQAARHRAQPPLSLLLPRSHASLNCLDSGPSTSSCQYAVGSLAAQRKQPLQHPRHRHRPIIHPAPPTPTSRIALFSSSATVSIATSSRRTLSDLPDKVEVQVGPAGR